MLYSSFILPIKNAISLVLRFILLCVFCAFGTTQASLSAVTGKTIQGRAPYLTLRDGTPLTSTNVNQLLDISMPDGNGGTVDIDASQTTAILVPAGMRFEQVTALIIADNTPHNVVDINYVDDDGDAGVASGVLTAVWKDGAGTVISNLNQQLSTSICESGTTYTLTINTSNLQAQSTYGNPNQTVYTDTDKTYTFLASPDLCYLKPADMTVNARGTASDYSYPGGYDLTVFDKTKGFIYQALTAKSYQFPQTGFNKASFTLVGSDDAADWACSIPSGSPAISLSGVGNCTVTYNSKPDSPIQIDMAYQGVIAAHYTIPVPQLWAKPVTGSYSYADEMNPDYITDYEAATACKGSVVETEAEARTFFFTRAELTNSPYATINDPEIGVGGRVSRAAEPVFLAEWGMVNNYKGSDWSRTYWTAETSIDSGESFSQFSVNNQGGTASSSWFMNTNGVVCR